MEEHDIDALSVIAGGRFNLVTLYCRRLRDLQKGMPALIEETEGLNHKEIVVEEIKQRKVWLLTGDDAEEHRLSRGKKAARALPSAAESEEEVAPKPPVR